MNRPDISVIIVNWNVKDLVLRLIDSIKQQSSGVSYEIVVVDNASADGSVAALLVRHPDIVLIANTENLGFAKAVNQGLRVATGRIMLVQNPDSLFGSNVLQGFVRALDTRKDLHIIGPKLLNEDGSVQASVRRFPGILDQALIALKLHHVFRRRGPIARYLADDFDYAHEASVEQLMGASFAFRRELLEKIGFLDERFFIWFEEVDFMKRAKDAQLSVRYLPSIQVMHLGGQSFGQVMSVKKQGYFSKSMMQYMRKHHGRAVGVLFAVLRPVSLLLAWLQALVMRFVGERGIVPLSVAFLLSLEAGSLVAHQVPMLAPWMLCIMTGLVFLASLFSLGYGLGAIALDLLVGSHGHLIGLGTQGAGGLSLRMTMFAAVLFAWLIRIVFKRERLPVVPLRFAMFAVAIGYAALMGILYHRAPGAVARDGTAFAFLALLLPIMSWMREGKERAAAFVFRVGVTWLALKTLVLAYIFSHFGVDVIRAAYVWVRDTRVAEVTRISGVFYRVFLPSQLFLGIALVIEFARAFGERRSLRWYGFIGLLSAALIASLSRSIALAVVVSLACVVIERIMRRTASFRSFFALVGRGCFAVIVGILLLAGTVFLPFPKQNGSLDLATVLRDRYSSTDDPAVGARWALLSPLWQEIKQSPLMGSGLGASVSYVSPDPFWQEANPGGLVTTTRFEWGWLGVWLKFGLVGGLFLLAYFASLARRLSGAALAVFVLLVATQATTPYLDHPIGLAVLLALEAFTWRDTVRTHSGSPAHP